MKTEAASIKLFCIRKIKNVVETPVQDDHWHVFRKYDSITFITLMKEFCRVTPLHGLFEVSLQTALKGKSIYSDCPMLLSK